MLVKKYRAPVTLLVIYSLGIATIIGSPVQGVVPSAHISNAKIAIEKKDLKTAKKEIELELSTQPNSAEAHYLLGMIYRDLAKPNEAIASLETAIKLRPDYVEAHYLHARTLLDSGRAVTGHLDTKPNSYRTIYNIDVLLSIRDEIDWAIDHGATYADPYMLAGMLEIGYITYRYHTAISEESKGHLEPARDVYVKALYYFDQALKLAKPNQRGYLELKSKVDFLRAYLDENFPKDKSFIRPKPRNIPLPEYTEEARRNRITGVILVGVRVDEHGGQGDKTVISGLGHGLDNEAIKAVSRIKFTPGTLNGKPVAVTCFVSVSFSLL